MTKKQILEVFAPRDSGKHYLTVHGKFSDDELEGIISVLIRELGIRTGLERAIEVVNRRTMNLRFSRRGER